MMRVQISSEAAKRCYWRWLGASALGLAFAGSVSGKALDEAVAEDALLGVVVEALAAYTIDVSANLNAREVVGVRIDAPRLGRFADLPINDLPDSSELQDWEVAYSLSEIGGLAIFANPDAGRTLTPVDFLAQWLNGSAAERALLTFHADDFATIELIQRVLTGYGYPTLLLYAAAQPTTAGEIYATAAQRLALDTRGARRYKSDIPEFAYLGERVRRNTDSLFKPDGNQGDSSLARGEPAVFQKESLGDEFTQSTIREIVVPGGVALGETAQLAVTAVALQFADGALQLSDSQGQIWQLPPLDTETLKALFDFVARSEAIGSDAIVDIDGDGRVRTAAALRDTDAGFALMEADTRPFDYVRNLDVTKSVIIDTGVRWFAGSAAGTLQFDSEFEVRFLSADNMRIAQTRVALEYAYKATSDTVVFEDSWGREAGRLHEDLDYAGLGTNVAVVARYAGWIGLFRLLEEQAVPFVHGRYAFMKLDKTGRATPSRY